MSDYLWEPRDESITIAPIEDAHDAIAAIRVGDTTHELWPGQHPAVLERAKAAARLLATAWVAHNESQPDCD